jgi:hypothetical protein
LAEECGRSGVSEEVADNEKTFIFAEEDISMEIKTPTLILTELKSFIMLR